MHVTDICSVTEMNDEASLSCFSETRLFKNNFSMLLIDLDSCSRCFSRSVA